MIRGDALWTRGQQESGACRPSLNEMMACVVLGFKESQGSPSWDPGAFDWSLAQVIGDVNLEGTLRLVSGFLLEGQSSVRRQQPFCLHLCV